MTTKYPVAEDEWVVVDEEIEHGDGKQENNSKKKREYSEKHQKRIQKCQQLHRTDIKNWKRQNYYQIWDAKMKPMLSTMFINNPPIVNQFSSVKEFREQFESKKIPCIISNLADKWSAKENWAVQNLRDLYGGIKFKCGEDDDGFPVKVKLETFCRYMENSQDDSPLYIFDTSYERTCPELIQDYCIPHIFPEDLFSLVGEKRRPPYRWFLIGPERSGTTVHIDPLETSAWNTLIRGRKLWMMFSPEVPKSVVKGKKYMKPNGDDEAIDWFWEMLPKIMMEDLAKSTCQTYRFIQYPGQTVFVPHGWWHAVLNLDDTVAVTQNYVSSVNFPDAWRSTRVERKKMARKWKRELKISRPDLYEVCCKIDQEDGYDLDQEIAHRKKEKRRKRKESRE